MINFNSLKSITLIINIMLVCHSFGNNTKIDSLLNEFRKAKYDSLKIKLLNDQIGYLYESINPDSAIFFYKKAIELAEKNLLINKTNKQYLLQKSNSLCYIGIVKTTQNEYNNAIKHYTESLKIKKEIDDKKGMSTCYNNIGLIQMSQGLFDNAIENFNKSLKANTELNESKRMSDCYINLGIAYRNKGDYNNSLKNYLNSLQISEGINDKKGMSACYNNIGNIYLYQEDYNKALEYYSNSLKINEELNDKRGMSDCYTNIGIITNYKRDFTKAIEFHFKSLKLAEEINDKKRIAMCYMNIGSLYSDKGDYDKAIDFYTKSLKIKEKLSDREGISSTNIKIGMLNISLADSAALSENQKVTYLKRAIDYLLKAYNIALENNVIPRVNQASKNLSIAYKKIGNPAKALEYAEVYMTTKDSLFSYEKTKSLTEMETKYQTEKKELQIDNLNKDNALKKSELEKSEEKRSKQLIIIYSFILGFIIIIVFSILLYRQYKAKKTANIILAKQNIEINQKNEEITSQRDEISAQRDMVAHQKGLLEEAHKELTDSILYAKRIQDAVLPITEEYKSVLGEHFIFFRPKDVVSGDFYWTTKIENNLIVCVADCTGHGVPGAFMSMLGISFLNEIVRKKEIIKASDILNELRKEIIHALKQKGQSGEQKDGMDISLIAINTTPQAQTSEGLEPSEVLWAYAAQWAGANNPLWVVRPKSQEPNLKNQENENISLNLELGACFLEFKGDKMPIAIYERIDSFNNHELQLYPGDTLYLMSDGYEDQFGGPKGKKFLSKNLKQLLIDFATGECSLNMTEQKEMLEKTLINWIGNGEQIDDITILGIKI